MCHEHTKDGSHRPHPHHIKTLRSSCLPELNFLPLQPLKPLAMSNNGIFDFTGFTGFNDTGFGFDNSSAIDDVFNFNTLNGGNGVGLDLQSHQYVCPSKLNSAWYLQSSEVGETSQPYTGVEVLRDRDGFSHLHNPVTGLTTLHPGRQVSLYKGKSRSPSSKTSFRNSFIRNRIQPTLSQGDDHPPTATHINSD